MDKITPTMIKEAEQQEREILNSKNDFFNTRHIQEERNLIELQDHDNEEEIYSSVQVMKF